MIRICDLNIVEYIDDRFDWTNNDHEINTVLIDIYIYIYRYCSNIFILRFMDNHA